MKKLLTVTLLLALAACGGGVDHNDAEGDTLAGGVCTASGTNFNCQGRICPKSGNGAICPDGQYCAMPQNLSVTANPVCASRSR